MNLRQLLLCVSVATAAGAASAADVGVSISIGGEIAPGVYGRIDLGNAAPPPVLYAQPVLVARPAPGVVIGPPVYLHVPPGHAKNWAKHCGKYNACGQRVYFAKSAEYEPNYRPGDKGDKGGKDKGQGQGNGKGNHGKGKND